MYYPIQLDPQHQSDQTRVHLLDFGRTVDIHSKKMDIVLDEARRCIEEIIMQMREEDLPIPIASSLESWQNDSHHEKLVWAMVEINPDFFSKEIERINVSISKAVLARLDSHAKKLKKTRSAIITQMTLTYDSDHLYDFWRKGS